MKLEVIIDSVESAMNAQKGGADRLELCANLVEGGTTPSIGMMKMCNDSVSLPINVMIRPRGGDFFYSENEFSIMKEDIKVAKELGLNGVVLGLLKTDGCVDVIRTKELVEYSRPMEVTFHRAIDMTPSLEDALEDIIKTGADRILTSGGKQKAEFGIDIVAQLVEKADGRIVVMVGSGVNDENISKMISGTSATEYHVSCRRKFKSEMVYRNDISMSGFEFDEYSKSVTDIKKIEQIKNVFKSVL